MNGGECTPMGTETGPGGKRQIQEWTGPFGDAYTDRNVVDWRTRLPLFRRMLDGLALARVLEVGCNRGHNLVALSELFGGRAAVLGIEPNAHARAIARAMAPGIQVCAGEAYALPIRDGSVDLAFTWGVLIHVPLAALGAALGEIHRVTRRFILAVEYFAPEETPVHYRGHDDLLWKRDFRRHYEERFPDLRLTKEGYWGREEGADRVYWWLLKRS